MANIQTSQEQPKRGWIRHVPLLAVFVVAAIGAVTLGEYLSFDTLRDNRETLLAFRDENFLGLALAQRAAHHPMMFSLENKRLSAIFCLSTATQRRCKIE